MKLILEDGTEFEGENFGADCAVAGEVVFNTGMTGYVEALTDPSYRGQILVCTYPLVGNYGVPEARAAGALDGPFESDRIQVQGLVVQHYHDDYSHSQATRSLGAWLRTENVTAITGVDTRTLTRRIREDGTCKGWLVSDGMTREQAAEAADEVDMKQVFDLVAPGEVTSYRAGELKVLVVDVGAKDNIVRALLDLDVSVIRASWKSDLVSLAEEVDGILIGNGPGNPEELVPLIEQVRHLLESYAKPIFGVCLGNQILALAAGASTFKLKYGHRGVNQPVQDLLSRHCYITSQNHGYAVRDESLPESWETWFVNLNDGTNEGIRSRTNPFFGVQFHPEAAPGPTDSSVLFRDFVRLVGAYRER